MKMDKVAGSKNDEYKTPSYAIKPILKYIKPNSVIWCPFDLEQSLFVKDLRTEGHKVIATHVFNGQDFFDLNIDCDYIISNPPFSKRTEIFTRLFELDKPFAMIIGVVGLFESQKRFEMFRDHEFEIMYLNRRISFLKEYTDEKPSANPPFSSVYLCHKMLPKQIVFEEITKA